MWGSGGRECEAIPGLATIGGDIVPARARDPLLSKGITFQCMDHASSIVTGYRHVTVEPQGLQGLLPGRSRTRMRVGTDTGNTGKSGENTV